MTVTDRISAGTVPARRVSARQLVRPWAAVLLIFAVLALSAVVVVFLNSATGQLFDEEAMAAVIAGRDARLAMLSVLGRISIGAAAIVALGCVIVAAIRGQIAHAIAAVAVIAGANITTQLLKHVLLDRPNFGVGLHNSLPSGHTTVVASLVAAAILVSPPLARPLLAAIGSFAIGVTGLATIVAGWHRPSDVVAAVLVTLGWLALVCLVLGGQRSKPFGSSLTALIGSAAAMIGLILVGVRPLAGWDGFIFAGAVLGAVAISTAILVAAMVTIVPGVKPQNATNSAAAPQYATTG